MKEMMHGQIASMREFFERSSRVLEEADSQYAPKPGMFTVSQLVAHSAQTIDWFMQGAFAEGGFGMDFDGMDKEVREVTSLRAAREWFAKACDAAGKVIDAHSEADWGGKLAEGPIMGGMPRMSIVATTA